MPFKDWMLMIGIILLVFAVIGGMGFGVLWFVTWAKVAWFS